MIGQQSQGHERNNMRIGNKLVWRKAYVKVSLKCQNICVLYICSPKGLDFTESFLYPGKQDDSPISALETL